MRATLAIRRTSRLTAGLTLLTLAFAGAVAALAPAVAQAVDGPDAPDKEPLEITETALYASPMWEAVPPTVRNQVPPEAVCVVRPDACPPESEDLRNLAVDTLATIGDNFPVAPVQPVPADSAAVSYFGGQPRYQTAIKFELPEPPAGDDIVSFVVEFDQIQPSYDLNSPAFRRVILGAFESIGPQDPSFAVEGLIKALDESALEMDGDVLSIEACPLLSAFDPAGAPQASHSDDLPHRGEEDAREVDVDCILGANGVRDDDGTWSFDLTFAAASWASGDLPNHGILLRPSGGYNLAFGDPDTSTNAQVVLDTEDVRAAMETAEALPDPGPMEPMGGFEDGMSFEEDGFEDDGFGGDFEDGAGFDADAPMDAGLSDAPDLDAEFADDDLGAAPMGDDPAVAAPVDTVAAGGSGAITPWWVWLLVPAFFGGAYLTNQALTAPAVATAAGAAQGGALSRLIAQRGAAAADPLRQV
jgi:hypothetical protein